MKCGICEERKARRSCPGLGRAICALCCGREREQSIDCPLDCEYLREARLHERPPVLDPSQIPHPEISVSDSYLEEHSELVMALGRALHAAISETPGAVDSDTAEALASLTRTYLTLQSGLYYESRPDNPIARSILQRFREGIEQFQRSLGEAGRSPARDSDLTTVLVFFERVGLNSFNGRRKGRAFFDFLHAHFGQSAAPQPSSGLIVTP